MKKLLSILLALAALTAHADEGMWTLHDLDSRTVAVMKKLGLKMNASDLYTAGQKGALKDAVVLFGGYCSGVVVSDQGLVFTNHHCGYSSIQKLSSPGEDLLRDGFVARTLEEERQAPGLFVAFLDSVMDVTPEVLALKAQGKSGDEACDEVEARYTSLGTYRTLDSYYGGTKYFLSIYQKYDDVRLVFTIPESLGKFGGDTDNWMWPRQTCDFSVFRVYKDGKPLHTPRYAKVTLKGQDEGGYCMTMGFPGSTERYLSSYGITSMMGTVNAARAEVRGVALQEWRRHMAADRTVGIKYSSKAASMSNYWKNAIGMNQALTTLEVVKEKEQLEARINAWIAQEPARQAKYGGVTDRLKQAYADAYADLRALRMLREFRIDCSPILRSLKALPRWEGDRRNKGLEDIAKLLKDYDLATDRDAVAAQLAYLQRSLAPEYVSTIKEDSASVRRLFDEVPLMGADGRMTESMMAFNDSVQHATLRLSRRLSPIYDSIDRDEKLLTQALLEMDFERPHYSDANMTMRVSFGTVQPYDNAEGTHYDCFTYPASLLEKANNGNTDYDLQPELVTLLKAGKWGRYADRRGRLPLCFLTTNDITGGNSGSPMFNGRGELLGLAFDGNWDALSSDVKFNTQMTRCIGVDIRYVMFLIDQWGRADRLVKEVLR